MVLGTDKSLSYVSPSLAGQDLPNRSSTYAEVFSNLGGIPKSFARVFPRQSTRETNASHLTFAEERKSSVFSACSALCDSFRPAPSRHDSADRVFVRIEHESDLSVGHRPFHGADRDNLPLGQIGSFLSFETKGIQMEANLERMARVIGNASPFQILKAIIQFIAVFVIDRREVVWIRNKRFSKHSVKRNRSIFGLSIPKLSSAIARHVDEGGLVVNTPQSSKIGNFVKRTANHWSPFFNDVFHAWHIAWPQEGVNRG